MSEVSYSVSSVGSQLVLVELEQVIDKGVPAVEHGVSHRGGRVAHHAELFLESNR